MFYIAVDARGRRLNGTFMFLNILQNVLKLDESKFNIFKLYLDYISIEWLFIKATSNKLNKNKIFPLMQSVSWKSAWSCFSPGLAIQHLSAFSIKHFLFFLIT